MRMLCFIQPDEQAGQGLTEQVQRQPSGVPGGVAPGSDTLALALIGAGGACLWLAAVLLVSGLMARMQLGYWPDASFCGLAFGAGLHECATGGGVLARVAGFLLDQVDAAVVIGTAGALLALAGVKRRA